MYIADLIALALFSLMNGLATEVWQVVLCRFLLWDGHRHGLSDRYLSAGGIPAAQGTRTPARCTFVGWAVCAAATFAVGYLLRDMGSDA
jgi:putative MFS transporter